MPPNSSVARKTDETHDKTTRNNLQLNDLKKSIPEAAFKKSFVKAVGAMILDYSLWFGTVALMKLLCESSIWTTLPVWQKVVASIVFWNLSGFFMWCLFMVGHDCGHNTFSDYEIVNDAIGHLTHGSLLVPFYSWQVVKLQKKCLQFLFHFRFNSFLTDAIICITTTMKKTILILGTLKIE